MLHPEIPQIAGLMVLRLRVRPNIKPLRKLSCDALMALTVTASLNRLGPFKALIQHWLLAGKPSCL